MARPCTICNSGSVRQAIEADALVGESIRSIARGYRSAGLSESAIRRHLASHVKPTPLRAFVISDELTLADAVGSVASGVREMLTVRENAISRGDTTATIRATAEGRAGAETLQKLGAVNGEAVADALQAFDRLRTALVRAAWVDPGTIRALAAASRDADPEVATDLSGLAETIATKLAAKKEKN